MLKEFLATDFPDFTVHGWKEAVPIVFTLSRQRRRCRWVLAESMHCSQAYEAGAYLYSSKFTATEICNLECSRCRIASGVGTRLQRTVTAINVPRSVFITVFLQMEVVIGSFKYPLYRYFRRCCSNLFSMWNFGISSKYAALSRLLQRISLVTGGKCKDYSLRAGRNPCFSPWCEIELLCSPPSSQEPDKFVAIRFANIPSSCVSALTEPPECTLLWSRLALNAA